jgi:hypothetical protein
MHAFEPASPIIASFEGEESHAPSFEEEESDAASFVAASLPPPSNAPPSFFAVVGPHATNKIERAKKVDFIIARRYASDIPAHASARLTMLARETLIFVSRRVSIGDDVPQCRSEIAPTRMTICQLRKQWEERPRSSDPVEQS